jgi:FKBP-type peptidyl-prolyl cis-trans isomerase 2
MSPHASESPSPVKSGELVQLEYELWAEGGGRTDLIDATREEVVQKATGSLPSGRTFGPRPHLVGGEYFPAGIEKALEGAQVGEEFEKEFAPAEAFGERDPNLIELFSMAEVQRLPEMRREDAELDIGTVLTIRGRRGRVVTLTQARVRVDFNPSFAGRKVRAKFKVLGRIDGPTEQVRALIELEYGHSKEFQVEVHGKSIVLTIPDRTKFDVAWFGAKPRVVDRLRTQLQPHSIRLVEEYVTPKTETPEKESAVPPVHAPAPEAAAPGADAAAKEGPAHTHAHPAKSK